MTNCGVWVCIYVTSGLTKGLGEGDIERLTAKERHLHRTVPNAVRCSAGENAKKVKFLYLLKMRVFCLVFFAPFASHLHWRLHRQVPAQVSRLNVLVFLGSA